MGASSPVGSAIDGCCLLLSTRWALPLLRTMKTATSMKAMTLHLSSPFPATSQGEAMVVESLFPFALFLARRILGLSFAEDVTAAPHTAAVHGISADESEERDTL